MKRISKNIHHNTGITLIKDANPTKVQIVMEELKEKLDDINETTDEIIDDVITPVAEFVVDDVVPIVKGIVEMLKAEPDSCVLSKETIKINEPVEETFTDINEELNTIQLSDPILAHEECLIKINPIGKAPIKHILSANLIFEVPCDDVTHDIVESDDNMSFSLFVKNNRNDNLNVKVCYHIQF